MRMEMLKCTYWDTTTTIFFVSTLASRVCGVMDGGVPGNPIGVCESEVVGMHFCTLTIYL